MSPRSCSIPLAISAACVVASAALSDAPAFAATRAARVVAIQQPLSRTQTPAPPSLANWPDNGIPISAYLPHWSAPVIIPDAAGGYLVAWRDMATGVAQIHVQRLAATGTQLWAPGGVAVAPTSGYQDLANLVAESDGGVLVVWADNRAGNWDVYAQRLTATGTIAAGWPASGVALAARPNDELGLEVVSDGLEGAYAVFGHLYQPGDLDVHVNRITGDGSIAPGWPAGGITVAGFASMEAYPAIAADPAGGAYVTWVDYGFVEDPAHVYASRITPAGAIAAGWPTNGKRLAEAAGNQDRPRVIGSTSGAIVVWTDDRSGDTQIYAQHVSGDASLLWGGSGLEVSGGRWQHDLPQLCTDAEGGAIAVWMDLRGASVELYAQHLSPAGARLWDDAGLRVYNNSLTYYMGYSWCLADDGVGGALVGWVDTRVPDDENIYAQHITGSGRRAWPLSGLAVCTAAQDQGPLGIARDSAGGATLAWIDGRNMTNSLFARQMTGFSNLNNTVPDFGWLTPALPLDAYPPGTQNLTVPPTLPGNEHVTHLLWQLHQEGPNPMPAFVARCQVDDDEPLDFAYPDSSGPESWVGIAYPYTVRGGRHTLAIVADPADEVPESNEADNTWSGQWVWSPLPLTLSTPVLRQVPPDAGSFAQPNCDGMQLTRPNLDCAWVVSLAPRAPGDDYELYLYDDYVGSTSGFSHLLARSDYQNNAVDFVVGTGAGTPSILYPAAVRYSIAGGGHRYYMDTADALGRRSSTAPAYWQHVELPSGRIADVYELTMRAEATNWLTLFREEGESLLEMAIFAPGNGVFSRFDALTHQPVYESIPLQFALPVAETGTYLVVIHRLDGDYTVNPLRYTFIWNEGPSPVDVPRGPVQHFELSLGAPVPNPAYGRTTLQYTLPERADARLEVFDVRGRRVRTLVDRTVEAGMHSETWRPGSGAVEPGVYWARLTALGRTLTRRVVILR